MLQQEIKIGIRKIKKNKLWIHEEILELMEETRKQKYVSDEDDKGKYKVIMN